MLGLETYDTVAERTDYTRRRLGLGVAAVLRRAHRGPSFLHLLL